MSDTHCYTYGVIESEELELDVDGVEGADRAHTVTHRTLSAVVTRIDTLEPERTDENMRAHDDVLRTVMEYDGGRTVVPMRFGMVFESARPLKNVLRSGRGPFARALRELDGTVELGVKLVADEDATHDRDGLREKAATRLREASVQEAENGRFSDRLVLNRSYLVDRDDRAAFDAAVDSLTDEHGDSLTVQYSGPWAPYNFIDMEITTQ